MMEDTQTESSSAIWRFVASCRDMTEHDRRNSWRATAWLAAWMVGFMVVGLSVRHELIPGGLPSYLAIAASGAVGVGAMLAYARFIREADELHRKIQLEAVALGFGAGFVATFVFRLLEQTGVESTGVDVVGVMVTFYMVGLFFGARRYA